MKNLIVSLLLGLSSTFTVALFPAQALNFTGNGNSGFGGVLGTGSIDLSDNGLTIQATFNKTGSQNFDNAIVIYIDSVSGGFNTTSGFNDQNDPLRQAISGVSGSGRSTVNFASGFNADYAVAFAPSQSFGGLWGLANGDNNSLIFVKSVNLTPLNETSSTYNFSFNLSDIGLISNSGSSFRFVATYLNPNNAFRSNEAIGNGLGSSNPGYNAVTFTNSASYTTATPVPFEFSPASSLLILGVFYLAKTKFSKVKKKN